MRRLGSVASWLGQVIAWLVILGMSATLLLAVVIPRIAGATPYVILTSSMRPAMPPGTLVVSRPTPVDRVGVGQVVTYQLHSGEPTVVTHRVVALRYTAGGHRRLVTRGDANDAADPKPVMPVQIRGERWYWVPYLGYLTNLFSAQQHRALVLVAVVLLLAYAGWMFVGAGRERWRSRRNGEATA